jgi:hypothetical protein
MRDDEPRPAWISLPTVVCVFITAVPITKLFAWGEGDSGGHVLREQTTPLDAESAHHALANAGGRDIV